MDARIFRIVTASLLLVLAVGTRLLPHQANFTAVTAVALAAGASLGWRWSAGVTLAAMLVSDVFLGFYHWPVMASVYGSLLGAGLIGRWVGRRVGWGRVVGGSIMSSLLFYLITNWAVWRFTLMYPLTLAGLWSSYLAALPFFRNSLVSDLFYAGVLFGVMEAVKIWRRDCSPRWVIARIIRGESFEARPR